jgi:hypothetical protein
VEDKMRIALSLLAAGAALTFPAAALAAPPANDNYLGSTRVPLEQTELSTTVDTTEATTQPDIFQPNADGQPLGGGPAEQTSCNGTGFGKTVWYDLAPPTDYGLQLRASAAFGVGVAIYEWNPQTSLPTKLVACSANATAEDLLPTLEAKKNYTVQVGGVANAGGPIGLSWTFFPDSDNDGAYDAIDDCPTVPGIGNSGCPPRLSVTPRVLFQNTGSGIILSKLFVERVPKGAKVVAKAAGVSQTIKAKKTGTITLTKFTGRAVASGKEIAVKVTMKAQGGKGKFRNGATGLYRRWTAKVGGLKSQPDRCLNAKTGKTEKCS